MSTFANMAIDLLCKLSFIPTGGYNREDWAATEQGWWQVLIHGLSPAEHLEAVRAIQSQVDELRCMYQTPMPEHIRQQLETLEAFIAGDIN